MHIHLSAMSAVITFLYVVVVGALWRFLAVKFAASDNQGLQHLGQAMSGIY